MIMNGNTPTLISGVPKVALSLATIRSHASARPSAPASTWPFAAQSVGLPELHDRLEQPREALRAEVLVHERHVGGELVEAAAGREDLLVRRGEHHAAHAVVGARELERRRSGRVSSSFESALRVSGWSRAMVATPSLDLIADRLVGTREISTMASMYTSIVVGIDRLGNR